MGDRPYGGKLADPAFRRERAQKAAHASHSLDAHIRAVVDAAPALTAEHVERLRALLPADQEQASRRDAA